MRAARPRGLPGSRLPPDVRPRHAGHGQVGGRGAQRRSAARVRGPRLPHRAARPPRPGGAGAARGHAERDDHRAGAAARAAGAGLARTRRAWPTARAVAFGAAAVADCRRQRLGCRGGGRVAAFCPGLAVAGGMRLSLPGHLRQPACAVRRRRGHRHQPESGRACAPCRPDHRAGPAPGRDDHRRLHAAASAAAAARARACACRRRGAGPRLRRRPAAASVDGLRGQGACHAGAACGASVGRLGPLAARRLRSQPGCTAGRADGPGRGDEDGAAAGAGRYRVHQRRWQLQRLAAPLRALSGFAAPRPHAAGADLGRDGLRPARGGRAPWSTSRAMATS